MFIEGLRFKLYISSGVSVLRVIVISLEVIYQVHQLTIQLEFPPSNLASILKVLTHVVLFLVQESKFKSSNHLSFSLDELGLFPDSLKMGVEDVLLCFHFLVLTVFTLVHLALSHYLIVGVSWDLLAHQRGWWSHQLLRNLVLLDILLIYSASWFLLTEVRMVE